MLVDNFLSASAIVYPDKIALVTEQGRFTYSEVDTMANRVANTLISAGFRRGDRAVIYMGNCLETVVSVFGVLKAGGVFVIIHPSTKEKKIQFLLNNCRASALITTTNIFLWSFDIADAVPSLKTIILDETYCLSNRDYSYNLLTLQDTFSSAADSPPSTTHSESDLAALIYTSGSTGVPKGVMMSHHNIDSASDSIIQYLENTQDDIILNVHPLSFDYGLYQVFMTFKTGGTLILRKNFGYPYSIINTLLNEEVTGFPIVPTILSIFDKIHDPGKLEFPNLRYITNTADVLTRKHIATLKRFFPQAKIYSMYGLTECKRVCYLPPEQLDKRPASVGKPMPNVEAYVVDKKGRKVGPGMEGELVVRGPNVMLGYWENKEDTDRCLKPINGSQEKILHTNDIFKTDEDGYLYFIRRKDDIIKIKGEKVSPREIEHIIAEISGVNQVAVVGVSDHRFGQAIKAIIVLEEGVRIGEIEILHYCAKHLEDNLIPRYVEFRRKLPLTSSGKVNKHCFSQGQNFEFLHERSNN
jgi:amino acid adenylation domain-containing protein